MASAVADPAAFLQFLDERSPADGEVGDVVMVEQRGRATVDAAPVALVDDSLLPPGGMALAAGCVDGSPLGVVDEDADERLGRDALDQGSGDRCAVVERASVRSDVEDDFGDEPGALAAQERQEPVRSLLRDGGPPRHGEWPGRVRGRVFSALRDLVIPMRLAHDPGVDGRHRLGRCGGGRRHVPTIMPSGSVRHVRLRASR